MKISGTHAEPLPWNGSLVFTHVGSILSSLFDTSPTISAAVTRHCVRRQDSRVKQFREELFRIVAGFHRRPGHTRALIQRTSTVDTTLPLKGFGTCWGSLRPEHHPGRGEAEGSVYIKRTDEKKKPDRWTRNVHTWYYTINNNMLCLVHIYMCYACYPLSPVATL